MCAPDVDAPEMSEEERELLRVQTEASKLMTELAKENMHVNRMLFPAAAAAIGFKPIYSQSQANQVFRPPTKTEEAAIEDRPLTGSEAPGDQGPVNVIAAGFSGVNRQATQKGGVGGAQMGITQHNVGAGPGSEPPTSAQEGQTEGGGPREPKTVGGDKSFGNIVGFEQVEQESPFSDIPKSSDFQRMSDELLSINIPQVREREDIRRDRDIAGSSAETRVAKRREFLTRQLQENLTDDDVNALRRALRG